MKREYENYKKNLLIGLLTANILCSCAHKEQPLRLNMPGTNAQKFLYGVGLGTVGACLLGSFIIIPQHMSNKSLPNNTTESGHKDVNSVIVNTLKPAYLHSTDLDQHSLKATAVNASEHMLTLAIHQFESSSSSTLAPLVLESPVEHALDKVEPVPEQDSNSIVIVLDDSDPLGAV